MIDAALSICPWLGLGALIWYVAAGDVGGVRRTKR